MIVAPLGDAALLVTCASEASEAASARVHALDAAVRAAAFPGVVACVPGYTTLLVHFEPRVADAVLLGDAIAGLDLSVVQTTARYWQIPAVYDGEDLQQVAAHLGLRPAQVVERHSAVDYFVACLGFAPGFAYLAGLPPSLRVPRRPMPRPQIAAGSLILGGQQTAIMPMPMPSGWHILGRTHLTLFDATRAEPCLLLPGDRVRFVPTDPRSLLQLAACCEIGA